MGAGWEAYRVKKSKGRRVYNGGHGGRRSTKEADSSRWPVADLPEPRVEYSVWIKENTACSGLRSLSQQTLSTVGKDDICSMTAVRQHVTTPSTGLLPLASSSLASSSLLRVLLTTTCPSVPAVSREQQRPHCTWCWVSLYLLVPSFFPSFVVSPFFSFLAFHFFVTAFLSFRWKYLGCKIALQADADISVWQLLDFLLVFFSTFVL